MQDQRRTFLLARTVPRHDIYVNLTYKCTVVGNEPYMTLVLCYRSARSHSHHSSVCHLVLPSQLAETLENEPIACHQQAFFDLFTSRRISLYFPNYPRVLLHYPQRVSIDSAIPVLLLHLRGKFCLKWRASASFPLDQKIIFSTEDLRRIVGTISLETSNQFHELNADFVSV